MSLSVGVQVTTANKISELEAPFNGAGNKKVQFHVERRLVPRLMDPVGPFS
jgi:hypothetical protein